MKYTKPKIFKPTEEELKKVAEKVAPKEKKLVQTVGCMSSSRTLDLIISRNLIINNCNSLKRLMAIAYTLY